MEVLKLVEKINNKYKQNKKIKKIIALISCFVIFITVSLFIKPGITLNETKYTLLLKDSYEYTWKENLTTDYSLDLYYVDINGNDIEGKNVTLEIKENGFKDIYYGFGYKPTNGEDLIELLDLYEYTLTTGEKYLFDHALVYVNDTWVRATDIWCQGASMSEQQSNYGWRSSNYLIDENIKYKFVYKLVRYGIDNSISSLGSDSGISFKMFNYEGTNEEVGINANGLHGYFNFRDSLKEGVVINPNTDADGFTEYRAKVLPNLENGYPVFDCQGYCNNTSLGYLFGKENAIGVTSYNATNTLLQKETIDSVEYYYYDSNRNAVDYDTYNNRFMLRDYVERGLTMSSYPKEINRYEFLPFNYLTTNELKSINDFTYNYEKEEIDHWFGMTMEFSFYMPKDGLINETDMIFSFSGDDDVWVFIDDALVLDLGGTHGAVDGNINFKTGEVTSYLNWNGVIGGSNTTTIYDSYVLANKEDKVTWNDKTFEDYTLHTVKFFYLERGAAISNCKIRFNIPVLPSGSLSVQKLFEETSYDENYEFTLFDVTSNTLVTNTKYTVGDQEYYTDELGRFTLKKDEVATFKLTNYHEYYVEETNPGIYSKSSNCVFDNIECESNSKTPNFTIEPDSAYLAKFTNEIKKHDLKILKNSYEGDLNEFEFILKLDNANNYEIISDNEFNIDGNVINFNLKHNESILIKNIPINTNIYLEEVSHDGYTTVIKSNGVSVASSDTYEFKMDSDKELIVNNTPGITLPQTGGSIFIYLFGLLSLIIPLKYLLKERV